MKWRIRVGFILWFVVFALYAFTAARTMTGFGDSDELVTAGVTLSVPHPPGYPLLVSIISLFSHVPFIPLSAVIMSLCMLMLYVVSLEFVKRIYKRIDNWMLFVVSLSVVAVSITGLVWEHGTYIEVFSLNTLFSLLLLELSIVVSHNKKPRRSISLLWGGVAGLGMAHHQTFVLILVPLVVFLFFHHFKQKKIVPILFALLGALASFCLSYGIILLLDMRQSLFSWQFSGLWQFYSRADYSGYSPQSGELSAWWSGVSINKTIEAWEFYIQELWRHWSVFGLIGIVGLLTSKKRLKQLFWLVLLPWIMAGPVLVGYLTLADAPIGTIEYETTRAILERMYLLSEVWWGLFVILGVVWLSNRFLRYLKNKVIIVSLAVCLLGITLYRIPKYDLSHYSAAKQYAESLITSLPANSSLICLSDVSCFGTLYVQGVLNIRNDVRVISNAPQYRYLAQKNEGYARFFYPDNPFRIGEIVGWSTYTDRPVYISQLNDYWSKELGLNAEAFWIVPSGYSLKVLRTIPQAQAINSTVLPLPEVARELVKHHRFIEVLRAILSEQYAINANLYARMGNREKAVETVMTGLSTYPDDPTLLKMRQLLPEMNTDPKYTQAVDEYSYLRKSQECREAGNIACDLWQSRFMAWRNPDTVLARLNFAEAFENASLDPLAKREYSHVLDLDENNVQAQFGLKRLEHVEDLK